MLIPIHTLKSTAVKVAQVTTVFLLVLGGAVHVLARDTGPIKTVVSWMGEPERRLHSQIGDLQAADAAPGTSSSRKSASSWESRQFGIGEWNAITTFHVVDGRVKRMLQEALAPTKFCNEASDWGGTGLTLNQELGVAPMVYTPTFVSGLWQQAALWHANRVAVVLYRTLTPDGECRVRMSIQ